MAFQSDSATDPKEVEALINELERKLDRLKVLYEQYFMGIEKREPTVPLKDVVRVMRKLDNEQIRNTSLRFRLRTLVQRFNTYRNYWNRTLREIDRGTYHRDVARLRRKMKRQGIEMAKTGPRSSVAEVERAIADAKKQAREQEQRQEQGQTAMSDAPYGGSALPPNPLDQIRGAVPNQIRDLPPEAYDESPTPPDPQPMTFDDLAPHGPPDPWRPDAFGAATQPGPPQYLPSGTQDPPGWHSEPPDTAVSPVFPETAPVNRPAAPPRREAPPAPPRREARPAPPRREARPAPPPKGRAPSDGELQALYRRFVRAKELCGEDTSGIKLDALRKSIHHQMPKLREKYKDRDVEFRVEIRSGRAILKAKPK